ncbi:MAG TPA: dihydropteroate synthase [Bacteroidales bacterium]|nr:dihydropteroate synthase [Bacteroidales bacterium]HPS63011.1 dihydropteroate synthase [Bacteroidales bacterium]
MKLFFGNKELDLAVPAVMGILNLTPDSFYDGGRYSRAEKPLLRVEKMLSEGAAMIDIGAVSTRPGAPEVDEAEELSRLIPVLDKLVKQFPEAIFSVDTFRAAVARAAVGHGAALINDIYGGRFEEAMLETVAALNVPYVLMHMQGTPATMQQNPGYTDVTGELLYFFESRLSRCRELGLRQVMIDPGFGFGKTVEQNYILLSELRQFRFPGHPLLVGLSRKSMICRALGIPPSEALNGTSVLNTIALMNGADILRVHDVREATEAIRLTRRLNLPGNGYL